MTTCTSTHPDGTSDSLRIDAMMMRYASGESAAFGELFAMLEPKLRQQLRALCRSDELARELTQETFLRIHRARRSFRDGRAALPWARAIARNCYCSHARSWGTRLQRASVDAELVPLRADDLLDAEAQLIVNERARLLHEAVAELGAGQRSALLLRAQGYSVGGAAHRLGVSEGAVKLRCFRTFRGLRKRLRGLEPTERSQR